MSVQASAQLLLKYTRSTWVCESLKAGKCTESQTRANARLAGLADGHEHNSLEVEMRACLVQLSKEVASYADQSQTEAARASDEAQKALSAGKITSEHLEFYREEEQISSKDIARLTHALKVLLDDSRAFAYATEHYVMAPVESSSTE